jgi:hypothetical protein
LPVKPGDFRGGGPLAGIKPPCTLHIAQFFEKIAMCSTSQGTEKIACWRQSRGSEPGPAGLGLKKMSSCHFIAARFQMASGTSSSRQPISVDSASSVYPYFRVFHRPAPDDSQPSKKSHIEQNFHILKRIKRNNRAEVWGYWMAMCLLFHLV